MHVAVENFIAGKEQKYKKGQEVKASADLLKSLKEQGLVQEVQAKVEAKAEVVHEEKEEKPAPPKKSKKQ